MKSLNMFHKSPADFVSLSVPYLVHAWRTGSDTDLRECSRVDLPCGIASTPFHDPNCAYVSVDWASANAFAGTILNQPPLNAQGRIDPQAVLVSAQKQFGVTDQARAAASLIADAIALPPGGYFDNGRHRVAAVADQDVLSEVWGIAGRL